MSPSAPVPKFHHPRQLIGAYAGWLGRTRAGPSHKSQFSVGGTGGVPVGRPTPLFSEAAGPVRPGVDLAHRAGVIGPNPFVGKPGPLGGVALVAHLGGCPGRTGVKTADAN